jgi:hypothetical protein
VGGGNSDVAAVAAVCGSYGVPLVVDEVRRTQPVYSYDEQQGCWEALCGTGRGSSSAGFGKAT